MCVGIVIPYIVEASLNHSVYQRILHIHAHSSRLFLVVCVVKKTRVIAHLQVCTDSAAVLLFAAIMDSNCVIPCLFIRDGERWMMQAPYGCKKTYCDGAAPRNFVC